MLHSLNALRVMAEYWVVRLHLSGLVDSHGGGLGLDIFTHDLLSFFFVLSGYVAGYSHRHKVFTTWIDIKRYWFSRWAKTYPVYTIWISVNLVGTLLRDKHGLSSSCSWFWPCVVGDYLLLSPWMFCESIEEPGVAWYLTTLYWLWLVFPFVHSHFIMDWIRDCFWTCVIVLYIFSLTPWILGIYFPFIAGSGTPTNNLSRVPLFRMFEFFMGYCASCSDNTRVSWFGMGIALVPFGGQYVVDAVLTKNYNTSCVTVDGPSLCYLWGPRASAVKSCVPTWDQFWSRTGLFWTILIKYCADNERISDNGIPVLNYCFWQDLSAFSLQMYLGHFSIAAILVTLSEWIVGFKIWHIDTLLLACYYTSYMFYTCIQPVLDRAAHSLWDPYHESQDVSPCSLESSETASESLA